jgi:hypothetical protein
LEGGPIFKKKKTFFFYIIFFWWGVGIPNGFIGGVNLFFFGGGRPENFKTFHFILFLFLKKKNGVGVS